MFPGMQASGFRAGRVRCLGDGARHRGGILFRYSRGDGFGIDLQPGGRAESTPWTCVKIIGEVMQTYTDIIIFYRLFRGYQAAAALNPRLTLTDRQ